MHRTAEITHCVADFKLILYVLLVFFNKFFKILLNKVIKGHYEKNGTCFLVHLVQSMFRKHLLDACVSHTINLTALSPKLLYLKHLSPNCNMYHPKYKISEQNFEYSLFYQP